MTLLKKINENWEPSEKRDLQVGEVFDFPGAYEQLVRSGMAILVDANGNELELPNQVLRCPICMQDITGLLNFVDHVSGHAGKKADKPTETKTATEEVVKPEPVVTVEAAKEEEKPVVEAVAPVAVEEDKVAEPVLSREEEIKAKRLAALAKAREAKKANQ